MPIINPYHRLWRPVKGYEFAGGWFNDEPHPTVPPSPPRGQCGGT